MSKAEQYENSINQIKALIDDEVDLVSNLSNIAAVLKQNHGFFWVGFYLEKGDQLVLGPFQGPVACTRIARNKGVCGTSWHENRSILVPDVQDFPGHIACNENSKSEVVIPVNNKSGEVNMVLDVDHDEYNFFDSTDLSNLELIADLIRERHG